jgi:prepilin-type N-terminal cleavage/methylation domain-containing protein
MIYEPCTTGLAIWAKRRCKELSTLNHQLSTPRRKAFTLIELLLSLALAAVLVGLLGMVVRQYLRVAEASRTHVEECQIARNVLRGIADDLRSAVLYASVDDATLEPLGDLAGGADLTAIEGLGAASGASGAAGEASAATDDVEDEASSLASAAEPPSQPGLYGTQYDLVVDVARIPRVDEYEAILLSEKPLADRPSDVKTVAYYVRDGVAAAGADADVEINPQESAGLVRRALDRAITTWAVDNGGVSDLDAQGDLFAPEVIALELRYYDGTEWLPDWDSSVRGGLPVAVEIAVALARDQQPVNLPSLFEPLSPELAQQVGVYRLLVHLLVAEPTDAQSETVIEE